MYILYKTILQICFNSLPQNDIRLRFVRSHWLLGCLVRYEIPKWTGEYHADWPEFAKAIACRIKVDHVEHLPFLFREVYQEFDRWN